MTTPDVLPIPPLRLRRVRLHGVGPDGARFDPLDLDFTTADGAASRILLSLTNTGGKSTLITLISSLVVPASRAQVGGKNLGDYILTGDTSHVVCEWEDAATGIRTVTGTVMEWKEGRRQPAYKQRSTTNMHRAWYLFRTGTNLPGIDDLPVIIDGRRAVFSTYLDTLAELLGQHPDTHWLHTRTQQEWTQALEDHTSIDPVLFSYQMRMNDSEAGAEKLLSAFDSPDNVVRFFIAALNNDREIADFTTKLTHYAELAANRPKLQALNDFCTKVGPTIAQIADKAAAANKATAAAIRAQTQGAELAGAAHTRMTDDRGLLDEQQREVAAATQAAIAARRDYGQISDIRLQLLLESARDRVKTAGEEVLRRTEEANAARDEASAWEAVNAVLDIQVAATRRDAAQAAYEAADAGLGPLRASVQAATARLAGRLDGLAREATAAAEAANARAYAARAEEREARTAEKDATTRRAAARRRLQDIDASIHAADTATVAAQQAGWLNAGETADQCLRRWQDIRGEATLRVEGETHRAAEADTARRAADIAKDSLDSTLTTLRGAAQTDRSRLQDFDSDFDRIAANPGVDHLLGGGAHTVDQIRRAQSLAGDAARDADQRAAAHEATAEDACEELAQLDETGTAATGPDVIAIVSALCEHRIGAVTGLQWIEHNIVDPDARRDFIAAHPDIAGGVIVSDPARLRDADTYLTEVKPRTRTPITVVANPTETDSSNLTTGPRFVVVPHRATWDRQWAQAARAEYEQTALREGDAASRARADASAHRATAAACAAFTDRWQDTRRDDLALAAHNSAQAVTAAQEQRDELITERDHQRDIAAQARANADAARKDVARAEKRVADARLLVERTEGAAIAALERVTVDADRLRAETDEATAEAAQAEAQAVISASIEEAAESRSNATTWQRERADLGIEHPGDDPGGNLEVIRAESKALRDELSAAERGMIEAEILDRANQTLSQAIARGDRYDPSVRQRAHELAALPAASSPDSLMGAQRRARNAAEACMSEQLTAEHAESRRRPAARRATHRR